MLGIHAASSIVENSSLVESYQLRFNHCWSPIFGNTKTPKCNCNISLPSSLSRRSVLGDDDALAEFGVEIDFVVTTFQQRSLHGRVVLDGGAPSNQCYKTVFSRLWLLNKVSGKPIQTRLMFASKATKSSSLPADIRQVANVIKHFCP